MCEVAEKTGMRLRYTWLLRTVRYRMSKATVNTMTGTVLGSTNGVTRQYDCIGRTSAIVRHDGGIGRHEIARECEAYRAPCAACVQSMVICGCTAHVADAAVPKSQLGGGRQVHEDVRVECVPLESTGRGRCIRDLRHITLNEKLHERAAPRSRSQVDRRCGLAPPPSSSTA